jgi:hypothetical protein
MYTKRFILLIFIETGFAFDMPFGFLFCECN